MHLPKKRTCRFQNDAAFRELQRRSGRIHEDGRLLQGLGPSQRVERGVVNRRYAIGELFGVNGHIGGTLTVFPVSGVARKPRRPDA
jgi:hypothetical protein